MYKILSIDGGGIKGITPASLLACVEETTGKNIIDHFDMISGTSTGGIIALGLGLGFSARELLALYMDNGDKIFKKKWWEFCPLLKNRGLLGTKYETEPLRNIIRTKFKGKLLGQSKTRLIIPAFDIVKNSICVFKTSHHERLELDFKQQAEDVALATAAAPTYFKPHTTLSGRSFVDGGMYANNPTLLAVIEGMSLLGWKKEEIAVLSLGCTEEVPIYGKLADKKPGSMGWGLGILDLFFNGQSGFSLGGAKLLLDDRNNEKILRISSMLPKGLVALDGVKMSDKLAGIGEEDARQNLDKIRKIFLADRVTPFTPCHSL